METPAVALDWNPCRCSFRQQQRPTNPHNLHQISRAQFAEAESACSFIVDLWTRGAKVWLKQQQHSAAHDTCRHGCPQAKLESSEASITALRTARRELSNQLGAAEEQEGSLRVANEDLQVRGMLQLQLPKLSRRGPSSIAPFACCRHHKAMPIFATVGL